MTKEERWLFRGMFSKTKVVVNHIQDKGNGCQGQVVFYNLRPGCQILCR
jgi:hypothetical protein